MILGNGFIAFRAVMHRRIDRPTKFDLLTAKFKRDLERGKLSGNLMRERFTKLIGNRFNCIGIIERYYFKGRLLQFN